MIKKTVGRKRRLTPGLGMALALVAGRCLAADCPTPVENARVAAVIGELDLVLEDGRLLRLAGLDPARATPSRPALGETARLALSNRLVGRDVTIAPLSAEPDRWERLPALVALTDLRSAVDSGGAASSGSLNEALIGEGWARAKPEPAIRSCVARFLAIEAKARSGRLGLWSDPYYGIVDADDRQALSERTGAMALVEGTARLRRADGRPDLSLGKTAYGFVATLARSAAKSLGRAGIDPRNLVGSKLRIRGFLDDRFGPRIDVTEAGQIEVLEARVPPE